MTTDRRSTPSPWTRAIWLAIALVGVAVVVLTLYAASGGIRGSDQYWYAADVDTIVHDHALTTNTVLPAGLLGPNPQVPPPFIHNILSVYLAAIPAFLVGSYGGWLLLNLAATLLTAALIYVAARRHASRWAALLCAAAYPLLPATIWLTAQPLAEASISVFAALLVLAITVARADAWRWLLAVAAAGLLFLSRQSYLPILVLVPFGYLVASLRDGRTERSSTAVRTAGLLVVAVAIVLIGNAVFSAQNVVSSYTRLLHTSVPGQTDNMWFNLDLSAANLTDKLPFDGGLLVTKLTANLAAQLWDFDGLPTLVFSWTFNLLVIVALYAALRYRRSDRLRVVIVALSLVAIHLLTIAVFQNQFRYTQPALPGLLVVLAMVLSDSRWLDRLIAPRPAVALVLLVVVALGPAFVVARQARSDGATQAGVQAAAIALLDAHLSPGDSTLIVYAQTPQVLAYAARPRLILYVADDYTRGDFDRVLQAFPARWILAPPGSRALEALGIQAGAQVGTIDGPNGSWGLYPLPAGGPTNAG